MVHTILIYAKIVNPAGACVALQVLISHLLAFVGMGRTPPLVVLARVSSQFTIPILFFIFSFCKNLYADVCL